MSAAWVAGSVKARLLLDRRFGATAARRLAEAASLGEATAALSGTAYDSAAISGTLEDGQRAVARCTLLRLRVLAAWLPPRGATGLGALAAWFELANIEDRLGYLSGGPLRAPFELGVFASVWDRAAGTQSVEELRALLAGSSWGDPGSVEVHELELALRFAWARRVAAAVPEARLWAAGAAAVLLAEELLVAGRPVSPVLVRGAGLGTGWENASTLAGLRARLPSPAAWPLVGIEQPAELWRAGLGWWRAVEADAERLVRSYRADRGPVVAAAALLGLDALRVSTALAVVAHGNAAPAREVLDALC
jgi:hypothetical protein